MVSFVEGHGTVLTVPSFTKKGKYYVIDDNGHCSCPGYFFHHKCKHVDIARELNLLPIVAQLNVVALQTPATTQNCTICNQPLTSAVEESTGKHGRCILKEMFS